MTGMFPESEVTEVDEKSLVMGGEEEAVEGEVVMENALFEGS